jgi:hypothetical protein
MPPRPALDADQLLAREGGQGRCSNAGGLQRRDRQLTPSGAEEVERLLLLAAQGNM